MGKQRRRALGLGGTAGLIGLAVAGFAATGLAAGSSQSNTTVSLRATAIGKVLVDSRGHTLYLFSKDSRGKSACTGACATAWPPLLSAKAPTGGAGVQASLLGRVKRGSTMQVTYAGHLLYRYGDDRSAGQLHGQRVGGEWFAVSPGGAAIKKAAPDNKAKTTTTTQTTTPTTTTTKQYPPPPGY